MSLYTHHICAVCCHEWDARGGIPSDCVVCWMDARDPADAVARKKRALWIRPGSWLETVCLWVMLFVDGPAPKTVGTVRLTPQRDGTVAARWSPTKPPPPNGKVRWVPPKGGTAAVRPRGRK